MDSHAETIEKQKERIRDLQTEREAAASAATTARDQVRQTSTHAASFPVLIPPHIMGRGQKKMRENARQHHSTTVSTIINNASTNTNKATAKRRSTAPSAQAHSPTRTHQHTTMTTRQNMRPTTNPCL